MNVLIALSPDEINVLMDHHAGCIGRGSETDSDRACQRIEQLRRLTAPERYYDIEQPAREQGTNA